MKEDTPEMTDEQFRDAMVKYHSDKLVKQLKKVLSKIGAKYELNGVRKLLGERIEVTDGK